MTSFSSPAYPASTFVAAIPKLCQLFSQAFYTVRMPGMASYYVIGQLFIDSAVSVIGNLVLFFSDFCRGLAFFKEIGLCEMLRSAGAMGRNLVRFCQIPFINIALGASTIAYSFFGIDAVVRLCRLTDKKERVRAWIDLIGSVLQVALSIILLCNITCLPLTLSLTIIGGIFGTLGCFYFFFRPQLAHEQK